MLPLCTGLAEVTVHVLFAELSFMTPVCWWCRVAEGRELILGCCCAITCYTCLLHTVTSSAQPDVLSPLPLDKFQHALIFSQCPRCLTSVSFPFSPFSFPIPTVLYSFSILAIFFLMVFFLLTCFFLPYCLLIPSTQLLKKKYVSLDSTFGLSMGFCLCIFPL